MKGCMECTMGSKFMVGKISFSAYLVIFINFTVVNRQSPVVQNLTTSLVNVSLNFQRLRSEIRQYFLLKKCEKFLHCKSFFHFLTKNISISVFGHKVIKCLTI